MDSAKFFTEHGWLVLRGVVPLDRVRDLEHAVDALHDLSSVKPGTVWEHEDVSNVSPTIARHARDPEIARAAAEALGCAGVRMLRDTVLVKAAREGGGLTWHQDCAYACYFDPLTVVSVRLALSDCKVDNGCLEVLDGSHKLGLLPSNADGRLIDQDLASRLSAHRRFVELEPGDLSLHHGLTIHASGANASLRPRKTLMSTFFDATCRFIPRLLPPSLARWFSEDASDALMDHAFPVLYQTSQ